MWRSSLVLALCCALSGPAFAGVNAGGILAVHDAGLSVSNTDGAAAICLQGIEPSTCVSMDTRIDGSGPSDHRIWKIYAAFPPGSSPRLMGVAFGINYDPSRLVVTNEATQMCGDFELPDTGWPGPNLGNSVTWNQVLLAHLVPVYCFSGYALAPTSFYATANPNGGGAFGDDHVPAVIDWIADYGRLGFDTDGFHPCPDRTPTTTTIVSDTPDPSYVGQLVTVRYSVQTEDGSTPSGMVTVSDGNASCAGTAEGDSCALQLYSLGVRTLTATYSGDSSHLPGTSPPVSHSVYFATTGACCSSTGACFVLSGPDCGILSGGGTYQGDWSVCFPNPCPQLAACCNPETFECTLVLEAACPFPGGWHSQWTSCSPDPCRLGACCDPETYACARTFESGCHDPQAWHAEWTGCDPNPCLPVRACCHPTTGLCTLVQEPLCPWPNIWHSGWTSCSPNICPQPWGACCAPDGTCTITSPSACVAPSTWLGLSTLCVPNHCPLPVPVERTTWGRIKDRYR